MFATNALFGLALCKVLVGKGVLTNQEAASIMVDTANLIRTGTEDDPIGNLGEDVARVFEKVAAMMLP